VVIADFRLLIGVFAPNQQSEINNQQ